MPHLRVCLFQAQRAEVWLHFLLGCLFAEPHALGFDPTVTRIPRSGCTTQYDITVLTAGGEERVFRTITALGGTGERHLTGRGTRVWKAVEIRDGTEIGEPVALKDCWVDDHRPREGAIYANVRKSASTDQEKRDLDNVLLSVLAEGDVYVNCALDYVPILDDGQPPMPLGPKHLGDVPPPKAKARIHYRVVFGEIGESLWQVESLSTVFRMIRDVFRGELDVLDR